MATTDINSASTPSPRPKKRLGQHFLIDRRILRRIVGAADLSPKDNVLEIGPGRGILTEELAKHAARVVAIEVDTVLVARLKDRFAGHKTVQVLAGDARNVDFATLLPEKVEYKVVANLPYYAASLIVRRLLQTNHPPSTMVVMFQHEVALNIVAKPGRMTMHSVAIQLFGKPRVICVVPRKAFRPPPNVTSAVVRIDVYDRPLLDVDSVEEFLRVVRAGFRAPRKRIRNSLSQGLPTDLGNSEQALAEAGIDLRRRPGTLSMQEWGAVYHAVKNLET